jgi:hypothetical protein
MTIHVLQRSLLPEEDPEDTATPGEIAKVLSETATNLLLNDPNVRWSLQAALDYIYDKTKHLVLTSKYLSKQSPDVKMDHAIEEFPIVQELDMGIEVNE